MLRGGWGSDKDLCSLGSRDEGSCNSKIGPRSSFLGGVPLSRYTSSYSITHGEVLTPQFSIDLYRQTLSAAKKIDNTQTI